MKCCRSIFVLLVLFQLGEISAQTPFTDVSAQVGINHTFDRGDYHFGGGVAAFDYNNDGYTDLYITGGFGRDALYQNNGNGTFTEVGIVAGIGGTDTIVTLGVSTGDIDNDGHRDIFVTTRTSEADTSTYVPNILFRNNGNGTFTDISAAAGIVHAGLSTTASFGDYNLDGYLDIYVGNFFDKPYPQVYGPDGKLEPKDFPNLRGGGNFFYLNNGNNTFTEIADSLNISNTGLTWANAFTDYNNDGLPDLYIGNDFGQFWKPNTMYRNGYPTHGFTNVSLYCNADEKGTAMGIATGDYNQDGWLDYYVTNYGKNTLYKNRGNGTFSEMTFAAGVEDEFVSPGVLPYKSIGWGTNFFDYDNDTYVDLYVANGGGAPEILSDWDTPNRLFKNNGNGTFTDMADSLGLANQYVGKGTAIFDFDNDGDQDIFLVNSKIDTPGIPGVSANCILYQNNLNSGNWLKVKAIGLRSNRDALGAHVIIRHQGKVYIKEVDGGSSAASQSSNVIHFGLDNITMVDTLEIAWPGGCRQLITQVAANQTLRIIEDTSVNRLFLPTEIIACKGDTVTLDLSYVQNGNFMWSNGTTGKVLQFPLTQSGIHTVTVSNNNKVCTDMVRVVIDSIPITASASVDTICLNGSGPVNLLAETQLYYDFEHGTEGWITGNLPKNYFGVNSINSTWAITDTAAGTQQLYLGSHTFGIPNIGNLGPENSYIQSPPLLLSGKVTFAFDTYVYDRVDAEGFINAQLVEVSFDNGLTWDALHDTRISVPEMHDTLYYNQWNHVEFSLFVPTVDQHISFRFRFDTGWSCIGNCGLDQIRGWYIDNVSINHGMDHLQSILWSPAASLNDASLQEPIATPTQTTTYTVSMLCETGCVATDEVTVVVNPNPTVSISASDTTFCPLGGSVQLNTSPLGGTLTGNGITNGNFVPVSATPGLHTLTYEYTDTNNCYSADSVTMQVFASPAVSFPGVDTLACVDDDPIPLYAEPIGGNWFSPAIFSNEFLPALASVGPNFINYSYTDSNGCESFTDLVITIADPANVTISMNDTEFCLDDAPAPVMVSPLGGTMVGTGLNNGVFSPLLADTGSHTLRYTLAGSNFCNSPPAQYDTAKLTVTVFGTSISNQDVMLCSGDSIDIGGSYQYNAGTYYDTLASIHGCDSIIITNLQLLPLPTAPVISRNGFNLSVANQYNSYQWHIDGSPIPGANSQTWIANANGNYHVEVTNANNCKTSSDTLNITNVSIAPTTQGTVMLYPNPFTHNFIIEVNGWQYPNAHIQMFNLVGKEIHIQTEHITHTNHWKVSPSSSISPGIYLLKVTYQGASFTAKVQKLP